MRAAQFCLHAQPCFTPWKLSKKIRGFPKVIFRHGDVKKKTLIAPFGWLRRSLHAVTLRRSTPEVQLRHFQLGTKTQLDYVADVNLLKGSQWKTEDFGWIIVDVLMVKTQQLFPCMDFIMFHWNVLLWAFSNDSNNSREAKTTYSVYLSAIGCSACEASLSNILCSGGCNGWSSSPKAWLQRCSSRWWRQASHRTCWFRSLFTRSCSMLATASCRSKACYRDKRRMCNRKIWFKREETIFFWVSRWSYTIKSPIKEIHLQNTHFRASGKSF